MNLQRDFVWNIDQKREIIMSVLIGRHIPHLAIVNCVDDTLQIIDGKQRLSSIIDFVNDKFTLILDGNEYYFSQLPTEYQIVINGYHIRYYVINDGIYGTNMTDDDKIIWFKFINFAGTEQDRNHLNNLK